MVFELVDILGNLTAQTVNFLPSLAGAIVLLVIGLVLGKVISRVVKEVLDRLKIDFYVTEKQKPIVSLSGLFALVTRWWIYLAFITEAVRVLGLAVLVDWVGRITTFVPNIIGATAIMVVGYILAEYIKIHLKKTNSLYANVVSKVLFFFILYVSIALALPVLGVASTLVNNILLVLIASVGIGVALALGLGMKEAVADISRRYAKKIRV